MERQTERQTMTIKELLLAEAKTRFPDEAQTQITAMQYINSAF